MGKINTVVFDYDGTLMDTSDVVINSWQHTYMTLTGKKAPVEEIYETLGEPLIESMEKKFPDVDAEEAIAIYRSYHYEKFEEMIDIFPGMIELIGELKNGGYNLAIVTSRLRNTTMRGLKAFELEDFFDVIITCEDTDKHKPDPEPLNCCLRKLGVSPEEAVMLGDSMFDIKCANSAGAGSVLVGWQLAVSEEEKKSEDGPDYEIEKAMDLLELLNREAAI